MLTATMCVSGLCVLKKLSPASIGTGFTFIISSKISVPPVIPFTNTTTSITIIYSAIDNPICTNGISSVNARHCHKRYNQDNR